MQNYILRYDLHAYFFVGTLNSPRSLFTKRREFVNNNTVQRHWLFVYTKLNRVSKLEDFLPWIFLYDVIACMVT